MRKLASAVWGLLQHFVRRSRPPLRFYNLHTCTGGMISKYVSLYLLGICIRRFHRELVSGVYATTPSSNSAAAKQEQTPFLKLITQFSPPPLRLESLQSTVKRDAQGRKRASILFHPLLFPQNLYIHDD